jgi:DNA primase
MDYENIDLIAVLEEADIPYAEGGSNVSQNWVGVPCPFCPDEDPSFHCGINRDSKIFSCWRCGEKGGLPKLLKKQLNSDWKVVFGLLEKFGGYTEGRVKALSSLSEPSRPLRIGFRVPSHPLSLGARNYLSDRGFDFELLTQLYDLRDGGQTGRYSYRIVIPVFSGRQMVTFTARDWTGRQDKRYLNQPRDEAIKPINHCLYGLNHAKGQTVCVVEGPADVWNMGRGFVATFTSNYSPIQAYLLTKFKRIFIMYDPGAEKQADKLAYELSISSNEVKILSLDSGDPGIMKQDDVNHVRKLIFNRIY